MNNIWHLMNYKTGWIGYTEIFHLSCKTGNYINQMIWRSVCLLYLPVCILLLCEGVTVKSFENLDKYYFHWIPERTEQYPKKQEA